MTIEISIPLITWLTLTGIQFPNEPLFQVWKSKTQHKLLILVDREVS